MTAQLFLRQVERHILAIASSSRPCGANVPKALFRLDLKTWQTTRGVSMLPNKMPVSAGSKISLSRDFHLSHPRRLHPMILAVITPLSRLGAIIVGRKVRMWYKNLPEEEQRKFWNKLKKNQGNFVGLGLLGAAFALYLYASHLEDCPMTGRRRFVALTDKQISKIGTQEFQNLLEHFEGKILPLNAVAYTRVAKVVNRILQTNKDLPRVHGKDWTITVIDSDITNAFVLPSGNIFVFTGMLNMCANDDQLGVVLCHEISHCILGHVAEKLSYLNFINLLILVPLALLWAVLPNDGIAIVAHWFFNSVIKIVFELPFSRDMEKEADEVGLILASKSCFDVREAPKFWTKMAKFENEDTPPEFVSTHPSSESRAEHLTELMPSALKLRLDCGCSKLGPEEGFFIKGVFPDIIVMAK